MAEPPAIRVDPTPNPHAMKFTAPRVLWSGRALTVTDPLQAFTFPLAGRLLAIPGVRSLFFLRDFVTVTRDPGTAWDTIVPRVVEALEQHVGE